MANSVIAAVVDKWATLTGAPTLYPFDAPVIEGGVQILPPYAVLTDNGLVPRFEFEYTPMEVTDLTIVVYAASLTAVDAYLEIIKYNGGALALKQGLDFGTLPTLALPYKKLSMVRARERRFLPAPTGRESQRIYGGELNYRVALYRY